MPSPPPARRAGVPPNAGFHPHSTPGSSGGIANRPPGAPASPETPAFTPTPPRAPGAESQPARPPIEYPRLENFEVPNRATTQARTAGGTRTVHTSATAYTVGWPGRYGHGLTAVG